MTAFGLGVNDASHALVVSRAVKRAMKERGLSAIEAIDDLTAKLEFSNLVVASEDEQDKEVQPHKVSSRPSSPQQQQQRTAAPTPTFPMLHQRKRKANNNTVKSMSTTNKNGKQKIKNHFQSRKRPAPQPRERADSVTEAVEAKAKKARLDDHNPVSSPDHASASSEPIMVRNKRNGASHAGDSSAQSNTTV